MIKKIKIIFIFSAFFSLFPLNAANNVLRQDGDRTLKYCFGFPHIFLNLFHESTKSDGEIGSLWQEYEESRSYNGPLYFTGIHTFEYSFIRKSKWEFGLSLGFSGLYQNKYDIFTNEKVSTKNSNFLMFSPVARYNYVSKKKFRFYSSFGLTMLNRIGTDGKVYGDNNVMKINVIPNVTLVGLSFGNRIFGFLEYGVSTHGLLRVGLGYSFEKNNRRK